MSVHIFQKQDHDKSETSESTEHTPITQMCSQRNVHWAHWNTTHTLLQASPGHQILLQVVWLNCLHLTSSAACMGKKREMTTFNFMAVWALLKQKNK